jgi:2,4-dienoyl-CoA reductase (NADPH2)
MDVRLHNKPVMCRVNPQVNRERELTYEPARQKKKVLVVGAGPSGMEAARVAALRGHEVYLYDKEPKLGGLLPLVALLKDLEIIDIMDLIKWFQLQLAELGVKVKLGQEVDDSIIEQLKPDVVIAAAGGIPGTVSILGLKSAKIMTSGDLHRQVKSFLRFFSPIMLETLTKIWMPIGKRVIIIGGRIHGCEMAEFLVKHSRKVTIVDDADALGEGMTGDDKFQLFPWLDKKGAKRYLGVKYNSISKGKLNITTKEGQNLTLEADTILTTLPLSSNTEVIQRLKDRAPEVYFTGDCQDPQLMAEATASGAIIGNSI